MSAAASRREALCEAVVAILIAVAIDLLISTAHGYKLVRPMWPLPPPFAATLLVVGVEIGVMGVLVAGLVMAMRWTPWIHSPWIRVLVAAGAPLLLWRWVAGLDWIAMVWAAIWGLGVASLSIIPGARRIRSLGPGKSAIVGSSILFGVALATALVVPSSVLREVDPGRAAASPDRSEEELNLLLIVLDTVRADHLPAYGYARDTMPFLTQLAAGATLFEQAVAASSYTLPSHATLFTGLLPERHAAHVVESGISLDRLGLLGDATPIAPLSGDATTLAELAQEAGMATGAVAANLAYLSTAFGLSQGFDDYIVPTQGWTSWQPAGLAIGRKLADRLLPAEAAFWYRSRITAQGRFYLLASEVNAIALRWLESRRDRRFFLFVNYMDAHAPYLPTPGYRDRYPLADSPQGADPRASLDAYDAELRYLDDQLSLLFAQLEDWGLLDRTLVVVVGDHGESFGEHGEYEHATGLHEHQLHVPLLIRHPGQKDGRRVARRVHLADVLPTVAEQLGLAISDDIDGTSLLAAERGEPVTAHLGPYGGIRARDALYRGPFKLIRLQERGQEPAESELYDLVSDPGEQRDLSIERRELAAELEQELARLKRKARPRFESAPAVVDEATRERLRALGYER